MMFIRGQAEMGGASPAAEPLHQLLGHQQIENPIDRDPVDRVISLNTSIDIGGAERIAVITDHLQYPNPVFCRFDSNLLQQIMIITFAAHRPD